jgi:thymidylate synthase
MRPRALIWNVGDAHIYQNQLAGVDEQIATEPVAFPRLRVCRALRDQQDPVDYLVSFTWDDIELIDYTPRKTIRFAMNA